MMKRPDFTYGADEYLQCTLQQLHEIYKKTKNEKECGEVTLSQM